MKFELRDVITIVVFVAGIAVTYGVMQGRIEDLQKDVASLQGQMKLVADAPLKVASLEQQAKGLRCEVKNINRVLQQKPEFNCDQQ